MTLGAVVSQEADLDGLADAFDGSELDVWDFATAALVLVAAIVLGRILRVVVRRIVQRARADSFLGDLIGRFANYVVIAFGLIYAFESLGIAVGPLLGALGIVGIALAFAFQDILQNFVSGVIIQVQRPFRSGDEIVTTDHEGTVTAVGARTVTIRTPDGETVLLPSAQVISSPITNHTQHGKRRTTLEVGVAYATDLDHATRVARRAAASIEAVHESPAPEVYVTSFGASSIDLAVRFWHEPSIATHWRTRHEVAKAIAAAFRTEDVSIPFPQRVVHFPEGIAVTTAEQHDELAETGRDGGSSQGELGRGGSDSRHQSRQS